ncbi:MAG: serine acetyltransferase, partial [Proteobacteria bacterium]|nr:serine acetyltransferase [Pseudomonadota bacterium]
MNIPLSDAETAGRAAAGWDLGRIVWQLREVRERWRDARQRKRDFGPREFPSREALREIAKGLSGALFPMRLGPRDLTKESEDFFVGRTLDTALNGLLHQVRLELVGQLGPEDGDRAALEARATEIVRAFARGLPGLRMLLDKDVQAAFDGDPAARSVDEVLLCYPGVLAV